MFSWRKILGQRGESLAESFLKKAGMDIVARNWRCKAGEIDLVALDGKTLVFVEVKARRSDDRLSPEANVTPGKQRRLRNLARLYMRTKDVESLRCRFDVVAVVDDGKSEPVIRHIPAAF